ncbi:hypothetical protein N7508_010950 [Penicillium antarcticum]|uniref:uncharacterized protein n=1 Tax=Penicillium antarcticum TaxID=416450 RepID=UPI00238B20E8|nr:uncharacterized protein N7508_010950 [Penicillium antarcticum]KAJ5296129.1 hypothetical protein N7508_010950 [Penicillium antarcticum]
MQHISVSPRNQVPSMRELPSPAELPPAKMTKLHPSKPGSENASLFFIGRACTIIEWHGTRVITDPNFAVEGEKIHLKRGVTSTCLTNPAVDLHNLPRIDLVLLSHYHEGYFDPKIEASLRRDIPIVTTPQVKTHLISKDQELFTSVSALRPFEHVDIYIQGTDGPKQPRLRVTGMPGKNVASKRVLQALTHATPPTNGWMLELGYGTADTPEFTCSYRISISGDILATKELQEVTRRYEGQPIDLMLARLGGTTLPSFLVGRIMEPLASTVNMDAEDGVTLMQLMKPGLTIPIHYDDFDLFKKKSPSNARTHHAVRSTEQLAEPPQSSFSSLGRSNTQNHSRDRPTVTLRPPSVSFKGKPISNPISNPSSPRVAQADENEVVAHFRPQSENPSPVTFERPASIAIQPVRGPRPTHPAHQDHDWSQTQLASQPASLQRSTTDLESPRYQTYRPFTPQESVLHSRPPSRYEPLSPETYPDAMQSTQSQAHSEKSAPDSSRRGSDTMPEPGRGTPTHRREDSGEIDVRDIDVRALIQKHDELQAKYSKVKRYYFEKDAQVQHLQNTVAHQRMAVSRTILDDSEYQNRFGRLDGAIKDLAFSVRKNWKGLPPWLKGMVTDDALEVGMKEMTAVGRAVISRWLVEEVFQRHFHPGLDPAFSVQLKSIEMNLRRQRPSSEEDRENASARLSYWRRTTLDGLGDSIIGPAADKNRAGLVEHLIGELATFMGSQLHDNLQLGLEAGVRMIIENSINIIEKVPLEARDVSVDYFPPGVSLAEQYMKVEGQLPHLPNPPPPVADPEVDEPTEGEVSSGSTVAPSENVSPAPKSHKKSMFGALMGRKPAPNDSGRPAVPGPEEKIEPAETTPSSPRIRFAAFLAVEVRGKGPATVLVKAPVWLVE